MPPPKRRFVLRHLSGWVVEPASNPGGLKGKILSFLEECFMACHTGQLLMLADVGAESGSKAGAVERCLEFFSSQGLTAGLVGLSKRCPSQPGAPALDKNHLVHLDPRPCHYLTCFPLQPPRLGSQPQDNGWPVSACKAKTWPCCRSRLTDPCLWPVTKDLRGAKSQVWDPESQTPSPSVPEAPRRRPPDLQLDCVS